MNKADIGLYGLGVMGENLALNMERNGFRVAVHNRPEEPGVVDTFMAGRGAGKRFAPAHTVADFIASLARPRRVLLMIRAGSPVDAVMAQLLPLLEPGDILIDGGNSHYRDTERRVAKAGASGIHYVGMGVSGGELGALNGPSLMPGGSAEAWPAIKPILTAIAAKAADGTPCCDWVGSGGAGHFVKMVHNGVEYGDMQLICEVYALLRSLEPGLSNDEMGAIFRDWNEGELGSYLIGITADILCYKDEKGDYPLDTILDAAGQKGTGKWASEAAFDLGVPLTLISEAVFARLLSARKEERVRAAQVGASASIGTIGGTRQDFATQFGRALYAAKVISYAQGFALLRAASESYGWDLDLGRVASLWREGCIIRSVFLDAIFHAFREDPGLENLMMAPYFGEVLTRRERDLAMTVSYGAMSGVALPGLSSALSYFYGYRTAESPANLLQAMRDYFGAHTFERTDRPRGEFFHIDWTGEGGTTHSGSYQV